MIRPARAADLPAIQTIVREAFSIYLPRMDRPPGPMLDDYADHIAGGRAFVLTEAGGILGVLVLIAKEDHLMLDVVATAPAAQGKGIGRRLVDFAVLETAGRGFKEVRLYTNEAMAENVPLYEHLGFVVTHRAVQNGYRRIFMTKVVG
jgi:GNAT superfamily N-acetyltransferase